LTLYVFSSLILIFLFKLFPANSAMAQTGRRHRCICLQTTKTPVPLRDIKKIEVIPPGGNCRQVEIIVTRKNGPPVCMDPEAPWVNFIRKLQEQQR
uniref:Chemokine interleukin-8-like domain-containing protein n=1 Tax=Myripristis murdjan TaxID=586833 RepID=A0A667YJ20_9TELE